jgi:hypothetical protein
MLGLSLHGWENAMVVSLIIAGFFALVAGAATWAVVRLQRIEIGESEQKFEKYKLETARVISEADARTKEAELKLAQLRKELGPRQLQRDIFIRELTGQPSAPVEIMYLQDDPECFALAQQISIALKDAGWPAENSRPIPSLVISDGPTPLSVDGQPSGVTVVVSGITQEESDAASNAMLGRDWVKTPWTVLSHAIGAALGKVSGHAGGPNAPPAGTLRLVVAPRL